MTKEKQKLTKGQDNPTNWLILFDWGGKKWRKEKLPLEALQRKSSYLSEWPGHASHTGKPETQRWSEPGGEWWFSRCWNETSPRSLKSQNQNNSGHNSNFSFESPINPGGGGGHTTTMTKPNYYFEDASVGNYSVYSLNSKYHNVKSIYKCLSFLRVIVSQNWQGVVRRGAGRNRCHISRVRRKGYLLIIYDVWCHLTIQSSITGHFMSFIVSINSVLTAKRIKKQTGVQI